MIQRMIRSLLMGVSNKRTSHEGFLRISLQREAALGSRPQPYIFDVDYFDGHLQGSFSASLEHLGTDENNHLHMPYRIGERLDLGSLLSPVDLRGFKSHLDRQLIDGDGKPYSLVVVSDELPQRDFELFGIRFRFESYGTFRARPLYLFLQAHPQ